MNKQALFSKAWTHFFIDGNPRAEVHGQCLYDTPTGGCAIGCLLPKSIRSRLPAMGIRSLVDFNNNQSVRRMFEKLECGTRDGAYGADVDFLSRLQTAHDLPLRGSGENLKNAFRRAMRALAKQHNLTIPKATRK